MNMNNFLKYTPSENDYTVPLKSYPKPLQEEKMQFVSKNIKENLAYAKKVFSYPQNADIIIREFTISVADRTYGAFIIFCDGLTSSDSINKSVLAPFMYMRNVSPSETATLTTIIEHQILTENLRESYFACSRASVTVVMSQTSVGP